MNIFYLDSNPATCAEYHCDKHVVKMIVEYAQLLSTAHRVIDGNHCRGISKTGRKQSTFVLPDDREFTLYRATHINHPSAVWVRESVDHYNWLYSLWINLMQEYTTRYSKQHATSRLINDLKNAPTNLAASGFVDPPPCMPDYCKVTGDSVQSYRNYYNNEKAHFTKWKLNKPLWVV